ncbi:chaplin [Actinacidiphila rubida]|uniref:Small secreted domain n=1 Tax=Actinacidiphila rubida TaxID=310780 RepID=A0A1H8TZH3_9ACTN|nr:chaplin [Actinacidiphila rubida]SEO96307.1 Small secreted domain [Actinacidiphila rubida]
MDRVARKGLVTAMVAGGVLASAGYAQADAAAGGDTAGSPGVLSGNSVQVPVHVPVNVCGNTIDVIGLLNPASGNSCANTSPSDPCPPGAAGEAHSGQQAATTRGGRHTGAPADESADALSSAGSGGGAHARGAAHGSPGVLSGNSLQIPVDVPVNVVGNSVNVVGVGNAAHGDTGVNGESAPAPRSAPPAHLPNPAPPASLPSAGPTLAHTGADGMGWAGAGSVAMLVGGASLYRRFRPGRP